MYNKNNSSSIMRFVIANIFALTLSVACPVFAAEDQVIGETDIVPASGQDLAAALRATMNWHPNIKSQRSEVEALEHAINAAKAGRYPTLSAEVNNVNENIDRGTVQVKQPVYAFGKIDAAISAARANWVVESWTLTQVQRKLIEDTAVAYAKMLGIQEQQKVAELNIHEHDKLYQRIKRRQDGQLASVADVNLAKSRLIQAQSRLDRIKGEWLTALAELQALTQVLVKADSPIDETSIVFPEVEAVEKLAIENSAELHIKREEAVAVGVNLKQERLSATPTLYFRVEHDALDQVDPRLKRTQSGFAIEAGLGGAGFVTLNRVKGAEAKLDSAQFDVDSAINDIQRRVQTLMLGVKIQEDLRQSQLETIAVVEETLASFMRQYDTGRKSWIDVLNTQRELTELRYQQVQINNERLILSLRVAALIGNLDKMAGIEAFNDNK